MNDAPIDETIIYGMTDEEGKTLEENDMSNVFGVFQENFPFNVILSKQSNDKWDNYKQTSDFDCRSKKFLKTTSFLKSQEEEHKDQEFVMACANHIYDEMGSIKKALAVTTKIITIIENDVYKDPNALFNLSNNKKEQFFFSLFNPQSFQIDKTKFLKRMIDVKKVFEVELESESKLDG